MASEPVVNPPRCLNTNSGHVNGQPELLTNDEQDDLATKRSERLRHVFPRPSRCSIHYGRASGPRVSKTDQYRSTLLYRRQLKPRGTLHRVINSFFGNHPERGAHGTSPQDRSRTSSSGSRLGSSVQGSVPSLDLISPGIFLFSGPYLQSAGSRSNSTPRLPSVTGSSRAVQTPRNQHSDSFSMVDVASVEEDLLEPIVGRGVVRSMSNVLLGINTPIEELGDPLFGNPNDGVVLKNPSCFQRPLNRASWSTYSLIADHMFQNLTIMALILHHSDTATWRSLRLVCRSWCNIVSGLVPPPARPASGRLPTEILLSIYNQLGAKDFNAARRSCRSWMMASLNAGMLSAMLHRGGWHSGGPTKDDGLSQKRTVATSSIEWRLSRYLSRQCAMASLWTGNGLNDGPPIVEDIAIDFTELANGYPVHKGRNSDALIFTSSICGKYLLVANDTLIYIYDLKDGLLEPISCVVCPRRVLAMSMNASVGRDAVAALLEGRMGMVCELQHHRPSPGPPSGDTCVEGHGHPPRQTPEPSTAIRRMNDMQDALDSAEHTSPTVLRTFPYIRDMSPASFHTIELKAHNHEFDLRDTGDISTHDRNLINQAWNLNLGGPRRHLRTASKTEGPVQRIPIESGTSTFYRHLCSDDDPPRNVSICPQRRCVAFGCSAGIELHWIDALSGQSLSRWFPLTSPSDHLYFLSPRPGFESAKKLRLISSAAHPNDRPAINRRSFSGAAISSFWGSFGFEPRSRQCPTCDHYRAIPLSDGHHVLFTDPSTERLTLGCDAPLGGPAKLLRKVVLDPPEGQGVPRVYTAAADMSSGARIVAVFDSTIMLYSIPPDVIALSRFEQASEGLEIYSTSPFSLTGRQHDHWLNWWNERTALNPSNGTEAEADSPIWPISLSGTEIGRLPDICELTIQTCPDILIWAFTYTAQCKTWRLRNYVDPVVRSKYYVDRSGLVHACYNIDESRDVIMRDAPPPGVDGRADGSHGRGDAAEAIGMVTFDGHASGVVKRISGALAVENDSLVDTIDVAGCADAWFEGDGDVVTWHEV